MPIAARLWVSHPRWKARALAVDHRHLLLLALLLASSALARAEDIAPPKVPRFEQAPCPKLAGAEELAKASCGYLVVPENRKPAEWPHHPAHGREIPRPLGGEAARPGCLSGRRAWRHRPARGQRAHRRRFHPRPRHLCGQPARHHVLGTGADLRGQRRLLQRASRPALLFRGNQARPFGRDGSLPPRARRHRRRPQRLQFDRERRRFRRSPQGARH